VLVVEVKIFDSGGDDGGNVVVFVWHFLNVDAFNKGKIKFK
jgi:hypothetical protein